MHRVPHISVYGDFQARDYKLIINSLRRLCEKYRYLPYGIEGFRWTKSEKGKVVYFNIVPSERLKRFRKDLFKTFQTIAPTSNRFDKLEPFLFHSTLAYKLTNSEFDRVWSTVQPRNGPISRLLQMFTRKRREKELVLPMYGLRVTLLNYHRKILCEYDFLQKKIFFRQDALNRHVWQKTLRLFRLDRGMEGAKEDKTSTYIISDLHLDHTNIIKYCARPFLLSDTDEMNRVLIDNWNSIVRNNEVYFLGDLSYGKGAKPTSHWLEKLSGKIHFIKGNHDNGKNPMKNQEILEYGGKKFLLIHDPDKAPSSWKGWVIHGHKHNNDLRRYPFINGERKTINVSAELLDYKPMSMDFLLSLEIDTIKRMDHIQSTPLRK